jgi:hypothetical protein
MQFKGKKRIIPQMFDIRPICEDGGLHWEKIRKAGNTIYLENKEYVFGKDREILDQIEMQDITPYPAGIESRAKKPEIRIIQDRGEIDVLAAVKEKKSFNEKAKQTLHEKSEAEYTGYPSRIIIAEKEFARYLNPKKIAFSFAAIAILILLVAVSFPLAKNISQKKSRVLGTNTQGYQKLEEGVQNLKEKNFERSQLDFSKAHGYFDSASRELGIGSSILAEIAKYFPLVSRYSSGKFSIEAGKHAALAGDELADIAKILEDIQNPFSIKKEPFSLLEIYQSLEGHLKKAVAELEAAEKNLNKINIDHVPQEKRAQFSEIKEKIPSIVVFVNGVSAHSDLITDILGGNGPRKYLFLFQNNQEMRATGGFIGSYGLLDINNGHVRNFLIDGIFEPDGQLKEKIIPPVPIQKISQAWSLHDSNWWPDFPRSAKKAMVLFEKTGSPTVDGVIAVTPEVMKKFLEITGPINLPEYDVTLDAENFVEKTQYEVEVDYNKEENRPKKILSDLAPLVLEKIFNAEDLDTILKTLKTIEGGLAEKHILIYSDNKKIQEIISGLGWSGEIKETAKDYVSVINTNINGYKTDGVIAEKIEYEAEIQDDGSVIGNLAITRKHNGGDTAYFWWNEVNADYISVEGQTRESDNPPVEYDKLGFKRDEDLESEEKDIEIDAGSGTRIYKDSGKTVFANWVYVSPKETVTIKYRYILPFNILSGGNSDANSYSLLAQKQSGSMGSEFSSKITFPSNFNVIWKYPDEISAGDNSLKYQADLRTDKFAGVAFTGK